jgi:hypothetical protein
MQCLPQAYNIGVEDLKARLLRDKPEYISIQLDGWTAHHTGYHGCIATWINAEWKRESVVLACSPFNVKHTSANIAEWILVCKT